VDFAATAPLASLVLLHADSENIPQALTHTAPIS
jgi:hypothetical protein